MRDIFEPEHEAFRTSFRAWLDKEVVPRYEEYERDGIVDRELFAAAGRHGFIGTAIPEQYGGGGVPDFRFNQVIAEELAACGAAGAGLGLTLHNDITIPYLTDIANDEQKQRWLPGVASGEIITALAMTEPGAGSDLQGMTTTAVRDGDEYLLNGSKTFITNGINADLIIVAAKTAGAERGGPLSLLVVERGMEGFERGRNLDKIGQHSQDTAELFFTDVRVPAANLLGEEGQGFSYLTFNLAQERLSLALMGLAVARSAIEWTVSYVKERNAFGKRIADFQNTKFELADCRTKVDIGQAFADQCVRRLNAGTLTPVEAAEAKLWMCELQNEVTDRCLQLFGGYGYMTEYPIGRAYVDSRITTIYGGTSEVMKTIISKDVLS
jgi:alkylation response protein AidB-like acyl-CoA dehydrogenase